MINRKIVLVLFLLVAPKAWAQSELANGEIQRNIEGFSQMVQQGAAYTNDEYARLPGVIRNFFSSSDCKITGAGPAILPNIETDFRAKPQHDHSGGLVCKTQQSGDVSEKSFKLCTAHAVNCSNSAIGGVQKKGVTFIAPAGQDCYNADAKQAFLNSVEANRMPGGIDVW